MTTPRVPMVVGAVARRHPIYVDDARFVVSETVRAIAATGVAVVQFDEPAFNVYFDEVRDWGMATLERAAAGLPCKTAVHICYGYGIKANNDWKKTLGSQWRQYEETFPLLARSSIDQVSLECASSCVPIELIGLLADKDVMVGAIDVASERVETPEDVAATIRAALRDVPAERLFPCTNCGMVLLPREVARGKLSALAAGAALVRRELSRTGQGPSAGHSTPGTGYSQTRRLGVCSQRCFVSSTLSTPKPGRRRRSRGAVPDCGSVLFCP